MAKKRNRKVKQKAQGVWIVYDLEANREIQKLLTQKKYSFMFVPNVELFWRFQWKDNLHKKMLSYYENRRKRGTKKCKHDYCDRQAEENGFCAYCIQLNTKMCNACGGARQCLR